MSYRTQGESVYPFITSSSLGFLRLLQGSQVFAQASPRLSQASKGMGYASLELAQASHGQDQPCYRLPQAYYARVLLKEACPGCLKSSWD